LNSLTASNIPPLISGSVTTGEDALEQAAKSLQKLYVNPVRCDQLIISFSYSK
jgi:hypothetical protein